MIYFDNAATTFPKPEQVYKNMDEFYRKYGINPGRGQYKISHKVNNMINDTRNKLLKLLNGKNLYKVIFTPSATISLNTIIQGLEYRNGENIYISQFEHNSVLRVLNLIGKKCKINVIPVKFDVNNLSFTSSEIRKQFEKYNPSKVIISHVSNSFGIVTPIEEILKYSKEYGAINIVDGSQSVGLIDINLLKSNIDFLVFAGHKTLYGPFGTAGFLMKNDTYLKPLIFGGTGIDSANLDMPIEIPVRYEAGSMNVQAISGLNSSLSWIEDKDISNLKQKEIEIKSKLIDCINSYSNIKIYGLSKESVGIVSCTFDGYSSAEIGKIFDKFDIAVRTGLHCSPLSHKLFGTFPNGTVRFSLSYFNSITDILELDRVLKYICDN